MKKCLLQAWGWCFKPGARSSCLHQSSHARPRVSGNSSSGSRSRSGWIQKCRHRFVEVLQQLSDLSFKPRVALWTREHAPRVWALKRTDSSIPTMTSCSTRPFPELHRASRADGLFLVRLPGRCHDQSRPLILP